MDAQTVIGYIRANLMLPGENFVAQFGKLTDKDKDDLKSYARDEMSVLGIPVK